MRPAAGAIDVSALKGPAVRLSKPSITRCSSNLQLWVFNHCPDSHDRGTRLLQSPYTLQEDWHAVAATAGVRTH